MTSLLATAARSYRFDIHQFHRMVAVGIFEDQKVELVAGRIYPMTDLPPHTYAVETFHDGLRAMLPRDQWTIREEKPVLIGRYWAPKPDLSILRGNHIHYARRQPRARRGRSGRDRRHDLSPRSRPKMAPVRRGRHSGLHHCPPQRSRYARRDLDGNNRQGQRCTVHRCGAYSARGSESVPIELDGTERGQIAVADLIARQ